MSTENLVATTHQVRRAPKKLSQPFRQWHIIPICNGQYTLTGYSRAADRTFLYIPQLRLGLDAGYVRGRQPKNVFITHTHKDHCHDIAYTSQRIGAKIFIPSEGQKVVHKFIQAEWDMNACIDGLHEQMELEKTYTLHAVQDGDVYTFTEDMQARVFKCFHAIPCVGYAFDRVKNKLKKEYLGMKGKDIAELKKNNVEITDRVIDPLFTYIGDTTPEVFDRSPWLFDYPTIIIECSFIYEKDEAEDESKKKKKKTIKKDTKDTKENSDITTEDVDGDELSHPPLYLKARKDGHTHWIDLAPIVRSHPQNHFVLIHFSLRYTEEEIYNFFEEEAKKMDLSNVTLFVSPSSEGRGDG